MKYLCLIYSDETQWPKLPKDQTDTMMAEYGEFTRSIKESGHYIGGHRLQPTGTATTLRSRNGQLSTTDGPFAETKEQLGGFNLIEADSMEEAVRIAERFPWARTGCIEVRAVRNLDTVREQVAAPPAS